MFVSSRDPIGLVSEPTNDFPMRKVFSWFIGDFGTGRVLSDYIDCGIMDGCLPNGCNPTVSPTRSPATVPPTVSPSNPPSVSQPTNFPTNRPTIESVVDRCVTVTITCNTT